ALLLLLVSNLLLWEIVASVPLSSDEIDDGQLYLRELFVRAMILSQDISMLNIEMHRIFTISESAAIFFDKFVYGTTENVDYASWSGLENFQSSDEDFRFFALCKLSYCLHVDIHTVDLSLMLLGCVVLINSDICSSPRIGDYS
ncbi:hypothetical protein STEG23_000808, partial [Scotinomys teguina]